MGILALVARLKAPTAVLFISLVLTTAACTAVAVTLDARNEARFEHAAHAARERLEARMETYVAMLRGTAGLFASSQGGVTRTEFRAYVDRLNVRERYPGIQGLGFSKHLSGQEGASSFPVVYLEPPDARNQAVMGFDMFSDPVRREAMERAWRSGAPALSGKVRFQREQEASPQGGFLLYVPVYRGGGVPASEAERLRSLEGFVFARFRADDFFASLFGREVSFRVYDGEAASPQSLLHDSARGAPAHLHGFERTASLGLAGRGWTVTFLSRPFFERAIPSSVVPLIGLSGLVMSLGLFGLARAQANARREAERTAQLLEAERARLSALFMAAPAAIAMTRGPEHVYVLSNPINNEWLGHREVLGRPVREALPESESTGFRALLDQVYRTGEPFSATEMPMRIAQPDGTERESFINFVYQPMRDADGNVDGITGFAFDVTAQVLERRKVEALAEELRSGQARLRTLVESNIVGVIFWDIEGGITGANDAFLQAVGYTREDLEAGHLDWRRLTPPDLHARDEVLVKELLEQGTHRPAEKEYLRKDGSRLPLIVASTFLPGSRREGVGFVLDITERKRVEQALRESEERFRDLADNISQLAWMADETGATFWFNRRWYEYTGTTPEQMRALGWKSVLEPQALARVESGFQAAMASGAPWEDTFPLRGSDGKYRSHLSRAMPLRDAEGRIVRWFGTNTDVEDQRRQAVELQQAIEARDIFLSVASHELKTPLTSLALRLAQLKREALGSEPEQQARTRQTRGLEIAERQLRKLAVLVDGLLDVSRIGEGRLSLALEEVDVAELVRETAQAMAPQAERAGSALEVEAPAHAVGTFDRVRLGQAVTNLLSNAIKFGAGRPIHLLLTATADKVRLTVSDEGIGIAPESLERIFNRFERGVSERHYGGLGLGLYLTRQIVEALGGTITVQSEPGRGATFRVELPVRPGGGA